MKKQQTFLIKIDDDQLRDFCSRLPLEETDQKIAFALATLSAPSGGVYAPARGVGQKELAKLAGVGVRTVKRRLTYLVRYGILSVERVNGKSNCYHFDLGMLLTAPAPTHNLYGYIKSKPSRETVKPIRKTNDRQRLLFDDVNQAAAAPTAQGECSLLSWMAGAVVQFTKRMFTSHSDECMLETGANAVKPGPTSQEPGPSSHNSDQNQCQTGANVSQSAGEPGPSGFFGAESPPEPGPNRGHPPQNRGQTSAKPGPSAPTLHQHNTSTGSGTLIKNHISHQHVDVDSDLDFFEGEAEALSDWSLPPSTTRKNSELPPGERKVVWGRDIRVDDLSNPAALQELYEIAVEQGFFLESEKTRENFFALAHYVCRQKKARSKVGLFSALVDRTSKSKIGCEWEKNLSHADDKWAVQAIHEYDFPPLERT